MQIGPNVFPESRGPLEKVEDKGVNQLSQIAKESLIGQDVEPIIDEHLINRIFKFIIPKDENDPFYNTDLVVFKDSYNGHLPLNGIRETEFNEIKKFYCDLEQDKTIFKITGDKIFKEKLFQGIKSLLTRSPGREIFFECLKRTDPIFIQESQTSSATIGLNHVTFLIKEDIDVIMNKEGKKELIQVPFFLTIAHELIHVLHGDVGEKDTRIQPNLSLMTDKKAEKEFDNIEEQRTITGLRSPLKVDFPTNEAISTEEWLKRMEIWEKEMEQDLSQKDYDFLNENRLRMVFGYPPRVDHRGAIKPLNLKDQDSGQFKDYFFTLIYYDAIPFLKELLDNNNIDLTKEIYNGMTSLGVAVYLGKPKAVEFLLDKGADIHWKSRDKQDLASLCIVGGDHKEILNLLVDKGLKLNPQHVDLLLSAIGNERKNILQYLLENGFSLSGANEIGQTLLELSVAYGNQKIVEYLASVGQDLNVVNSKGQTLCHIAILYQKPAILKFLMDKGVDIQKPDGDGNTPLQLAFIHFRANKEITDFFLGHDLFPVLKDVSSNTRQSILSDMTPLELSMLIIKNQLLSEKVNLNETNMKGQTLVHAAVMAKDVGSLKWLDQCGVDLYKPDHQGQTPLELAVVNGDQKSIEFFMGKGIDIKKFENSKGQNLCHIAASYNQLRLLNWLVKEQGVDINKPDHKGDTPLHVAGSGNFALWCIHEIICTLLVPMGANPTLKNLEGKTASEM